MYKAFIVDDEELVIKSLIASVNWKEHNFEVAGYALNGTDAQMAIEELKPELIFTDIRMPGISGLELIKKIREKFPEVLIILISGYAEFAFAQKAINYGAFGYCLKPFDEMEIEGFLKKANAVLVNTSWSIETDILDILEDNSEQANDKLRNMLYRSGTGFEPGEGMRVMVSIGRSRLNPDGSGKWVAFRIGFNKYVYLLKETGAESLNRFLGDHINEDIKGIGVSDVIHEARQIKDAIRVAELNSYSYFTAGVKNGFSLHSVNMQNSIIILRQLRTATTQNQVSSIFALLDQMRTLFKQGQMNIKHALTVYKNVMSLACQTETENDEEDIYSLDKMTGSFNTVEDLLCYLKELLHRFHMNKEPVSHKGRSRTLASILQYIHEHFCEEISIHIIAKHFNFNANYISQLFRKEIETTFTEYLCKLRVERACYLLTASDMLISEVAESVGYNDYFYFSRIFKRLLGKSPSTYRAET